MPVGLTYALLLVSADPGLLPSPVYDSPGAGAPEGWRLEIATGECAVERVADPALPTGGFVRLTAPTEGQTDLRPTAGFFPARAGSAYLLAASVRAGNPASGSHALEIHWFGEGGFLRRDQAQCFAADGWATVALGPVEPPEGASEGIVLLRVYGAGAYDFADVRLLAFEGIAPGLVANGGLESDSDADGTPDGWLLGEGAVWDAETAASGARSVRLERSGAMLRQTGIPVEPGRSYELSAAVKSATFGRELRLAVEWLHGTEVVGSEEMRDQTFEAWQRKRLSLTCPPEADHAAVVLSLESEGTIWFDDAALAPLDVLASVTLDLVRPNPRGLIRQGKDAPELLAECRVTSRDADARGSVQLLAGDGAALASWEVSPAEEATELRYDTSRLALGAYTLLAEVRSAEGKLLTSEAARLDVLPADARGVFFREDHIAEVNGEPWFPIGVCSIRPTDDEAASLAQAGFNLLVTDVFSQGAPEEVTRLLDRAGELGLYITEWSNGWVYGTRREDREAALRKVAATAGTHPRYIGLACDEAIWNGVALGEVLDSYHTARALMPTLLYWQNQAPRNSIADLARYCRGADVTGMDIYPVEGSEHSDLPNKTLSVVGDEVEKNIATVGGRKPVWAILQGFGWNVWSADIATHRRAPTWDETRFMAYDAIVHGAVGIIYWGANYESREADIWTSLRRIAGELRDLTPALVSPERLDLPMVGGPVRMIARRAEGKWWIVAVNESDRAFRVTMPIPGTTGPLARWAEEGPALEQDAAAIEDDFAPWGVHVYREE